MPSTMSSSVSSDLASSTVMTPSLPTFFMASASILPISVSPLAEMVPTCAISSLVETFFERFWMSWTTASTAKSMPRLRSIGFMPAATALTPSRTMAWARMVAVVVPSPATVLVLLATSRTICAPIFSNLSVSTSIPCSIRSRASVPSLISLAAMIAFLSARLCSGGAALEEAHDVGLLHDHQFFAVDLDLGARPFPEQHAVAGLDVERLHLPVFPAGPRPDSDDLAFHRLFLGGVRNDDPSRRFRLLLDTPHEHAIVQRSEFHENLRKLEIEYGQPSQG